MNSLITKLLALVRSPRARAAIEQARNQARNQAAKPQNRRRLEQLRARFGQPR